MNNPFRVSLILSLTLSCLISATIPSIAHGAGWSATASMNSPRYQHTATRLPTGKVLVTGGYSYDPSYLGYIPVASAELYDPVSATWSNAGKMAFAHSGHTATLLPNGNVLVVGGYELNSVELYNPAKNIWTNARSMASGRAVHTATLLPSRTRTRPD